MTKICEGPLNSQHLSYLNWKKSVLYIQLNPLFFYFMIVNFIKFYPNPHFTHFYYFFTIQKFKFFISFSLDFKCVKIGLFCKVEKPIKFRIIFLAWLCNFFHDFEFWKEITYSGQEYDSKPYKLLKYSRVQYLAKIWPIQNMYKSSINFTLFQWQIY